MPHDRRDRKRITIYRAELPTGEVREVEYEAVADALHFACRDLREGRRLPLAILEDGAVVYDRDSIASACGEMESERAAGQDRAG